MKSSEQMIADAIARTPPGQLPQCPRFVPMTMTYEDDVEPLEAPKFRILAQITTGSFAGFVSSHVFAATVKKQFSNAHLAVYHRNDRPFKNDIVALNPAIDQVIEPAEDGSVTLDDFEVTYRTYRMKQRNQNPQWYQDGMHWWDFIIAPTMAADMRMTGWGKPARLVVPRDRENELDLQLATQGIDPARWHVVLHYRDPSWKHVAANWLRDADPALYLDVAARIINELGGQVVRIGHPGMTPWPAMRGLADLSEASTMAQAHAVSKARFFLNGGSGAFMLAMGFGVPCLAVCTPDVWGGFGDGHLMLAQHLIGPDGKRIPPHVAHEREMLSTQAITALVRNHGYRVIKNSADEIMAGCRAMMEQRPAAEAANEPAPPNRFMWPPRVANPWFLLDFPELSPGA